MAHNKLDAIASMHMWNVANQLATRLLEPLLQKSKED